MRPTTTDGAPIAVASFTRLGQITQSRTRLGSASSAGPSSAASSTSTSAPHRSPDQDQWLSSGTPQDHVLILGERHLHAVLIEYQAHYNMARPHQGIGQSIPSDERDAPRATMIDVDSERIRRKPVLGGLINEYTHAA
jgi:hypothetical protein